MGTQVKNSILIVDDEKSNLMVLNRMLSRYYTLYMARNGIEAVKLANEYKPDLVLLDIVMPGMGGYEVLSELKKSEHTKEIPVILITGLGGSDDEIKGLVFGADDYISKPFVDMIVKLRIKNQLKIINQIRAIERLSMTDQLTQLPNRRSFNKQIDVEWRRAVREKHHISVLMIDIDRFKAYNDTYGHQQGDAALVEAAKTISQTLKRAGDFPARWGGEEFSVVLSSTDKKGALLIAEQIRSNIEQAEVLCPNGKAAKITVSIGVNTLIPTQDDAIEEFFSKADKSLYEAKKRGRNKVCHYDDLDS